MDVSARNDGFDVGVRGGFTETEAAHLPGGRRMPAGDRGRKALARDRLMWQ